MRVDCKFKNLDYSQNLVEYAEERIERIQKFQLNDVDLHITVYKQKHRKCVDVSILGSENNYKATGKSNDYYVSLDLAFNKLKTQMRKKKAKVQSYRHFESSREGQLERAYEEMRQEPVNKAS